MEWDRSRMLEWVRWLAMLVIAGQLFAGSAMAQDATPVVPEPADAALEQSSTPTPPPAELTPAADEAVSEPTATAEPVPAPYLAFALGDAPACLADADMSTELASGGSVEYVCTSQLAIDGEALSSGDVLITWSIGAVITPGWSVQLLPPAPSPDTAPVWTEPDGNEARFAFEQFSSLGPAAEAGSFSGIATIEYRVRVNRPTCLGGAPELEISQSADVGAPETSGVDLEGGTVAAPFLITPVLASIPAPAISFDGPLDFGTIEATARGLNQTRIDGQLSVTVRGLDHACGTYTLQLSATPIVDEHGAVREGFALLIGECNLTDGCAALQVEAGPNSAPEITHTVIITLQTPQYAALGALGTTIDATLIASADGT